MIRYLYVQNDVAIKFSYDKPTKEDEEMMTDGSITIFRITDDEIVDLYDGSYINES